MPNWGQLLPIVFALYSITPNSIIRNIYAFIDSNNKYEQPHGDPQNRQHCAGDNSNNCAKKYANIKTEKTQQKSFANWWICSWRGSGGGNGNDDIRNILKHYRRMWMIKAINTIPLTLFGVVICFVIWWIPWKTCEYAHDIQMAPKVKCY